MPPIKRPSRYIRPEGYRTPKNIVESTPNIKKKEAIFTKEKGPFNEWYEISRKGTRAEGSAWFDPSLVKDKLHHTHSTYRGNKRILLPSRNDLSTFLKQYYKKGINNQGISIIDHKTGKITGRTHFTFTNKTIELIDKIYTKYISTRNSLDRVQTINYIKTLLFDELLRSKIGSNYNLIKIFSMNRKKFIKILEHDFGIKLRFVPMPGYKFNPQKVMFEKIK